MIVLHCLGRLREAHGSIVAIPVGSSTTPRRRAASFAKASKDNRGTFHDDPSQPDFLRRLVKLFVMAYCMTVNEIRSLLCRLIQRRGRSSYFLSSTTNFYSSLSGSPNPLDETDPRVYTFHLGTIRRYVFTTTNDAREDLTHHTYDGSYGSAIGPLSISDSIATTAHAVRTRHGAPDQPPRHSKAHSVRPL